MSRWRRSPIQRLLERVAHFGPDDCWIAGPYKRYGRISYEGQQAQAHRAVYEFFRGPIRRELVIDHLCRVTQCVNPAHMEPVTNKENILRGTSPSAICAKKTHCPSGHEYGEENVRVDRRGKRHCRECERLRSARYFMAHREKERMRRKNYRLRAALAKKEAGRG